ncbi:MAG: hypothetical protein P1S60_13260 [Anaerolineae bacterium]|nr:hypothetical protein [Anaerolineae bacterium]
MSLIKHLFNKLFNTSHHEVKDSNGLYFYIQCAKCGTPVRIRIDKTRDLQRDYDTGEFFLRKEVMDGGCFSLMYAQIRFNSAYQVIEQTVEGGRFISWETYNQLAHPGPSTTPENQEP